MDNIRFENGRCYVGDSISLESPLEAFGQHKLVSAFTELVRDQVLFVAGVVGLEVGTITTEKGTSVNVPYDELRWTAQAILQREWFLNIPGGVPKVVQQNYDERMTHYLSVVERIKRGETVNTTASATPKAAKAPKVNVTYTYELVTAKYDVDEKMKAKVANEATTNHDAIIVSILLKHTTPVAIAAIVEPVLNTGRYETKDPLEKSVRWHLNKLEKEGLVIAHEHAVAAAPQAETASTGNGEEVAQQAKPPVVKGTKADRKQAAQANKAQGA